MQADAGKHIYANKYTQTNVNTVTFRKRKYWNICCKKYIYGVSILRNCLGLISFKICTNVLFHLGQWPEVTSEKENTKKKKWQKAMSTWKKCSYVWVCLWIWHCSPYDIVLCKKIQVNQIRPYFAPHISFQIQHFFVVFSFYRVHCTSLDLIS